MGLIISLELGGLSRGLNLPEQVWLLETDMVITFRHRKSGENNHGRDESVSRTGSRVCCSDVIPTLIISCLSCISWATKKAVLTSSLVSVCPT